MRESPRVLVYVLSCSVIASAALVIAWRTAPPVGVTSISTIIILVAVCLLSMHAIVRSLQTNVDLSMNFIVQLAALALVGPAAALIVGGAPSALELRRTPWIVRVFNVSLHLIEMAVASLVFVLLGGDWDAGLQTGQEVILRHLALPLMAANGAMLLTSSGLLAGIIALDKGVPYREVAVGILRSIGLPYMGYGVFGLLLVVLWSAAGVGPLSAVLVLAPLFVARWAFAQYAAQHAAHERTVAALVSAVEAKDRYTRGHSERVARASMLIGRTVGLSQQRTSTLHFAGMLHDVGKLGVPTRVLQKTGALTDEEFATIARHPVRGLEMVREIEFLGEALQGILHHHERLDGRGYPLGLQGGSIPEFARIIAVADAFDSMTSTRSYRQARTVMEAMSELRACSGTQFDPRFVTALGQSLERTEWEPVTGGAPEAPTVADAPDSRASFIDHDDPGFGPTMDDDRGAESWVRSRGEDA